MGSEEDAWDAFGSDGDDDDDDDDNDNSTHEDKGNNVLDLIGIGVATFLAQAFLKADPHIRLSQRIVFVLEQKSVVVEALRQRGIVVVTELGTEQGQMMDAMVVFADLTVNEDVDLSRLVPGGIFISNDISIFRGKHFSDPVPIEPMGGGGTMFESVKLPAHPAHTSRCLWLVNHSLETERRLMQSASRYLSSHEIYTGMMTETSIQKAVQCLNESGYCIVRGLLDPRVCRTWGAAVLESVHSAAKILLARDEVDIFRPHTSKFEPQAYRELSMREDLRFDIRDAPELRSLRGEEADGNIPVVIKGGHKSFDGFLRGNQNILEIVRRTMNPRNGTLFRGNLGRFNFGGSGTDGSYQDLRVSPVGGIVTLPGCGDQAIHADTPHLFEHIPDLPAHYINVFVPGTEFNPKVGGTAFIHGSHNLEFTTKYCGSTDGYKASFPFLVRPALDLGDVVLFDCRVLHFGMANDTDSALERVLLYTNTTMAWFSDPKNWDDRRQIFE